MSLHAAWQTVQLSCGAWEMTARSRWNSSQLMDDLGTFFPSGQWRQSAIDSIVDSFRCSKICWIFLTLVLRISHSSCLPARRQTNIIAGGWLLRWRWLCRCANGKWLLGCVPTGKFTNRRDIDLDYYSSFARPESPEKNIPGCPSPWWYCDIVCRKSQRNKKLFSRNLLLYCLSNNYLVNKHRPWKWPIFNGN